jgi:predicted Zn-dependent protease with MMP-like domain
VSLTERTHDHTGLPDRITVFRRPRMEMCRDRAELVHEIGVTVVHEVAHHFGIDDARLHELGYG